MPTYDQQMKQIERRRRMAQMLMQQGMQPQGQQAGRFFVGPSTASSLAGLAGVLGGGLMNRRADREEGEAQAAEQERLAKAMERIMGGASDPGVDPVTGQGPAMHAAPDPRMQAARDVIGGLSVEQQQQALGGQALKTLFPPAPKPKEDFTLTPGGARFDASGKPIASLPAAEKPATQIGSISPSDFTPQSLARFQQTGSMADLERITPTADKPVAQYKTLTPEEVAAAGLPAGTSAQRNLQNGQIDVLSRRDNTGTLSQKDATTARLKLNTVQLAKQQLAAVKAAFDEGRTGLNAFGPAQGMLPTQAGKKFDALVDQMRSTLTALTRVPGVGAMSDYETRLDQGKFPNRSGYESTIETQIEGLENQLATIENGYTGLLGGGAAGAQSEEPAAPGGDVATIKSDADFDALPSGTEFVGPDGVRRRKP